jgi:hypothetical protein
MELIQAIALLCQVSSGSINHENIEKTQLWCQQSYIHCVSVKSVKLDKHLALEQCVLEKK